ncbi:MAG: response regulator [Verrucomicrobia bacterium]|nr:response regulator [Verrucomicrobiota bacterium]
MPSILLIEDDDLLCDVLTKVLRSVGYSVMVATDGRKALALFHAEPADLIVTDIVMPDQDGLEVIMALHREQPELPIVAISGAKPELYLGLAARLGARRTLSKPFSPETLLRAVADLLPPPSAPAPPPRS